MLQRGITLQTLCRILKKTYKNNTNLLTMLLCTQAPSPSATTKAIAQTCKLITAHYKLPPDHLDRVLNASILTEEVAAGVIEHFHNEYRKEPAWRFFLWATTHSCYTPGTHVCHKIINTLAEANCPKDIWVVLRIMGDNQVLHKETLMVAVTAIARCRQTQSAAEVFGLFKEFNHDTLNMVFRALCEEELGVESYKILKILMEKEGLCYVKPNHETLGFILRGLCRNRKLIVALKVWNKIIKIVDVKNLDMTVCNEFIGLLFVYKKYEWASRVFCALHSRATSETYEVAIIGLCRHVGLMRALTLFDEMCDKGLKPTIGIYNALIRALGRSHRMEQAYWYLDEVHKSEKTSAYNALIEAMVDMDNAIEASRLFDRMVAEGCEPVMCTYVLLLQVWFGSKKGKEAPPGCDFYTIFVGALIKAGRSREASRSILGLIGAKDYEELRPFKYGKFLHYVSIDQGLQEVFRLAAERLKEHSWAGIARVFLRYLAMMTTSRKTSKPATPCLT